MNQKILIVLGLVWSVSGFSQRVLSDYSPPQKVVVPDIPGASIRMLPGFHANANDGSYNGSNNKFVAKIGDPSETILPSSTIGDTGASLTDNYVYTRSYLVPVTLSNSYAPQIQSITYFDGLGRPKQNIGIKSSTTGKDLVTPVIYDNFGRQTRDYLPIPQSGTKNAEIYPQTSSMVDFPVANSGGIHPSAEKIFSEKKLENSPLDRILEQYGAGADWQSKSKRSQFDYQTNGNNEVLKFVTSTTSSALSLATGNYYSQATLYKNKVTDEDDNESYEFKNGQGQTLLVRKMLTATESADTYYVYNEYDQLAYVLSPLASAAIKSNFSVTQTILDELCYQYRYDGRNRLVEKKLPGKGLDPDTGVWHWEYMVYDNQDRLVMTQDANLGANKQWLFTKYDQFGRVAYTGLYTSVKAYESAGRLYEQGQVNDKGNNNVARMSSSGFTVPGLIVYYDNLAAKNYPNTIDKLLSVNYYDTYPKDKPDLSDLGFTQSFITDDAQSNNISTKSLPVASYLNNIEMDSWTKTFSYYDDRGRSVATYSKNHLGGHTQTESTLDFTGTPQKTITKHTRRNGGAVVQITERFTYDHQNRLKEHYHQIDSKPEVLLTENTYNELGRLIKKKVGNNLQEIDYAYNIRGWMTNINNISSLGNDLFAYKINYNTLSITNTKPLADQSLEIKPKFNGNISQVDWLYANTPRNVGNSYGYVYDGLNRLKAGFYYNRLLSRYQFTEEHNELPQYDINGNISFLKRFSYRIGTAPSMIDDLTYQYTGNRLTSITDASEDDNGYEGGGNPISYDANGNMTVMPDKNINQISYNFLNLPNAMELGAGKLRASNSSIYRADGTKLKKVYTSRRIGIGGSINTIVSTTDYLDGFQYLEVNPPGLFLTGGGLAEDNDLDLAMEREAFQREVIADPTMVPGEGTTTENFVLQFVPTAEGYYSFTENRYIYQYKDHLGNVRVSFARDSAGNIEVTDKNDYYPFGMNHLNPDTGAYFGQSSYKNYKYNGKELQETGMYDYGARMYMPDIGRWGVIDEKAEKYRRWSPYTYAIDNPINVIDPDGRDIIYVIRDSNGGVSEQWKYSKGNFYRWENGKLGVKYDGRTHTGSPGLFTLAKTYRTIENSNMKNTKGMLHTLESSKKTHWVEGGDGGSRVYPDGNGSGQGIGIGTQTIYDFSNDTKKDFQESEGISNSNLSAVVHEMRHQFDYDQGNMVDAKKDKDPDSGTARDPSEQRGVKAENEARDFEGMQRRKTYGGENVTPNPDNYILPGQKIREENKRSGLPNDNRIY